MPEEKPYKVTSEKKLPFIPWKVNSNPKKVLFNSLKIITHGCLLEYLNGINSSNREKLTWEINKELKLGWGREGGKKQTLQFPGRKEKTVKNINYKIKPFCTDTNQLHVLALKAILCIIANRASVMYSLAN